MGTLVVMVLQDEATCTKWHLVRRRMVLTRDLEQPSAAIRLFEMSLSRL